MVYFMETPYFSMDDLGGFYPYIWFNAHIIERVPINPLNQVINLYSVIDMHSYFIDVYGTKTYNTVFPLTQKLERNNVTKKWQVLPSPF